MIVLMSILAFIAYLVSLFAVKGWSFSIGKLKFEKKSGRVNDKVLEALKASDETIKKIIRVLDELLEG